MQLTAIDQHAIAITACYMPTLSQPNQETTRANTSHQSCAVLRRHARTQSLAKITPYAGAQTPGNHGITTPPDLSIPLLALRTARSIRTWVHGFSCQTGNRRCYTLPGPRWVACTLLSVSPVVATQPVSRVGLRWSETAKSLPSFDTRWTPSSSAM